LPQALILTAIVIGFAMVTFLLILLYRAYAYAGTLDADEGPFSKSGGRTMPVRSLSSGPAGD
jgi:multicomponent Na+:H+ antiporter subunit C